jgi:hypothetical protein
LQYNNVVGNDIQCDGKQLQKRENGNRKLFYCEKCVSFKMAGILPTKKVYFLNRKLFIPHFQLSLMLSRVIF